MVGQALGGLDILSVLSAGIWLSSLVIVRFEIWSVWGPWVWNPRDCYGGRALTAGGALVGFSWGLQVAIVFSYCKL